LESKVTTTLQEIIQDWCKLSKEIEQKAAGDYAHLVVEEAIIHPEFQWDVVSYDGLERVVYLPK
jgi:hypothetical protein